MDSGSSNTKPDLLRRVFVPVEHRMSDGNFIFRTTDREVYQRDAETGVIRRVRAKVSKQERKRRKHANA